MDLDKLLKLHREGRSQREIAGELGVSQPAVAKALKRVITPADNQGDNPSDNRGAGAPERPDLSPPLVRSGPAYARWVNEVRNPWLQSVGARDAAVTKRGRF